MTISPNPPATVDAESFSVTRTVTIAASPDKVWAAITKPEHIIHWAGQAATIDSLEVGGKGAWTWEKYGTVPLVIEQIDPPHSITYRWGSHDDDAVDPERSTAFQFTLEPDGEGTKLTVVETGFDGWGDPVEHMEGNREGWDHELDELVVYLEGAA